MPNSGRYNPDDNLSQWIGPPHASLPPGWYVYRTFFNVPPAYESYSNYGLLMTGQMMGDDQVAAIYIADPAGDATTCHPLGEFTVADQYQAWQPFSIGATVAPDTAGILYFIVYNTGTVPNPTGLRVEFITAGYYPTN